MKRTCEIIMTKIKVGLVGAGHSAKNIVASISTFEDIELVAISAATIEEAQEFTKTYKIEKICTDYHELVNLSKIDVVIVSVPHFLHYPITMAALNAKKHVLCEKPLAISLDEGNEMIKVAQENNLILGTFLQNRFNESSQRAKNAIKNGEIGDIVQGMVNVFWSRNQAYYDDSPWRGKWATEGGGSLINQSCHTIDLLLWLMGNPKTLFGVFAAKTHKIEVDDTSAAVITFVNDVYATIQTSVCADRRYPSVIEIYGTKGMVHLSEQFLKIVKDDGSVEEKKYPNEFGSSSDVYGISRKNHHDLIMDYFNAVKEKRNPLVDGKEGMRSIEVIMAIYESKGQKIIQF
jgi:UDP-N-acetyl-2-amino-2-deoxyglucuronate dehydrogenase